MEPSFKRQRISATQGQQRHSPGYDDHSRSYGATTLRQPPNPNPVAVYDSNNDSSKFYEAVNTREVSADFDNTETDEDYESGEEYYEEEAPEADLHATRQKLDNRLKSTFEAIFEKYGKDFTGVGDEIDLRTGEIIVDNGHVAEMHAETDAGEARGRGMLRAFTEEPEHARLPLGEIGDPDETDEADEDTDEAYEDTEADYHVRGRQMLRAFTQEPDFGRVTSTGEDVNDYDGDTSNLNTIDEESDDDDILYQSSGVIPAKSMAPPPRPPIHNPYLQKLQSRFHAPKPVPRPRVSSNGAACLPKPDIIEQFGHEIGPRIAEYVSRQQSVDEGSVDPKWRTPALPAATAGNRPILKSMILQPSMERSPSPNGNSLWAPEKRPQRRRRKADRTDPEPSAEGDTVVRDQVVISRERIVRSGVSAQPTHLPKIAQFKVPQNPSQQDSASKSSGQNPDNNILDDNEPGNSTGVEESVADASYISEPVKKRRRRRPGQSETWLPRNQYTDAEDKQLLEWCKWVYHETEYGFWSPKHWGLLSKKNPRHSGTAYRQRYRKLYNRNGGQHPFLGPGAATIPSKATSNAPPNAPARFRPFKDILHELYVVEGHSLSQVMSIMERQHGFIESETQFRRNFSLWGFKKVGYWLEDRPEFAGMTREEARLQKRRELQERSKQLQKKKEKNGVPLPTPDPDAGPGETDNTESRNKERRARRMRRRGTTGQLSELDHDGIEQRNEANEIRDTEIAGGSSSGTEIYRSDKSDAEANTSTRNEAGRDPESNDHEGASEDRGSNDLSKLFQGASDYISPNSETTTREDQSLELPKYRSEHNNDSDTNDTGRSLLRSRVIPNSQSSQGLLSPITSQAKKDQPTAPVAPMVELSRDALDPSYMFSDEEDEAAPVLPQTLPSDPQVFSASTETPEPQPPTDLAPVITPPAQEQDIPPQNASTKIPPTEQPDTVAASVEIKDEPGTIGRGLGDVYALPRNAPRLPTAPEPTAGSALRVVVTQPAISSPFTSPAARTPTPPTTVAATSTSKDIPKKSSKLESTPVRSQPSLLKLSATPTSRRNPMERSTSRPRFTSQSKTGSAHSRASMTPISRLAIRSPLRNGVVKDEDGSSEGVPSSSRRSRATDSGILNLSPRNGLRAGVAGTPSRRSRVGSGNGGGGENGDLVQTPGGAWRRCGESGYKCGRGFCFRCSIGGEGEVEA